MNTQRDIQSEAFQRFAQVTVERRRLTRSDLELQILPSAVRATNPQPEHPQRGTALRAAYFVEVYVARPVSRVPGGSSASADQGLKTQTTKVIASTPIRWSSTGGSSVDRAR